MDRVKNKAIPYLIMGSRLYMNSKDEFKFNNYRRVFNSEVFTPYSIFEKIKKILLITLCLLSVNHLFLLSILTLVSSIISL